ncbi:hypothetical protein SPI_09041 [Niveomyces insectorum RCEF 264]|uniref:Uncharacterized protein n=1 Tax=Niveomyces insectorum RCEF 264 TaxID=1081102 RepID=A0A167M9P6_9HYPO|nr:hypothetical protein SPI_09041 [Niveomyces insectorum RCEF 264]
MNSSLPLSTPPQRRMPPRPRPASPLVPRRNDCDELRGGNNHDHDNEDSDFGYGGDRSGFYQISLSNGPSSRQQQQRHAGDPLSLSYQQQQQQRRPYSAYLADNYNGNITTTTTTGYSNGADLHRPVQEYHNAFAHADNASTRVPAPSSPFASFSSASRAFLQHRRQQSFPTLLPSIASSIGKNLGRAISPDRQLRQTRPTISEYRREEEEEEGGEGGGHEAGSGIGGRQHYGCRGEEGESDDASEGEAANMAPFTGDARTKRANTYTTYKSSRSLLSSNINNTTGGGSPSSASGSFTSWLPGGGRGGGVGSGGSGSSINSPDRASFVSSSRATTPEPTGLGLRGGMASSNRSMSFASDASVTPRSLGVAPSSASSSRFSQLASSMSATLSRLTQQQQSPVSPGRAATVGGHHSAVGLEHDELYVLDVDAALFPADQPSDRNAFSPSAFKNLESNARGVLTRLQTAYRQRTLALRDLAAEKSVRDEELEEAETRAQHLKMQLEGMARRAADQEKDMQLLMDQLAAEKKARAQERAMLLAGVPRTPTASTAMADTIRDGDADHEHQHNHHHHDVAATVVSEDLGVEEAQRAQKRRNAWRRKSLKSDGSGGYDDTDEGDEESAVDEDESSSSVFSRSRSPTIAPSINVHYDAGGGGGSSSSIHGDLPIHTFSHPRVAALGSASKGGRSGGPSSAAAAHAPQQQSPQQQQPLSTFQKLMKNVTAAIKDEEPEVVGGLSNCRNCRGQDVSFAWNTVSVLRDENKHLKQRVGQLEVAVESALDVVNGVGLD